jgi:hypothetical protein
VVIPALLNNLNYYRSVNQEQCNGAMSRWFSRYFASGHGGSLSFAADLHEVEGGLSGLWRLRTGV